MPRLKLTIAYVGTHYQGWQVQAWKNRPNPPTVQGEIERALADVVGRPVHVQGAGRTDSGVHADAQIAHCDVPEEKTRLDWVLALNTRLPHDIRVTDFAYVPDDFNACFSVVRKAYTYSLWLNRRYVPRVCTLLSGDAVRWISTGWTPPYPFWLASMISPACATAVRTPGTACVPCIPSPVRRPPCPGRKTWCCCVSSPTAF